MNRRFGFVLGFSSLVGLALLGGAATSLGGGGAAPTARAVPRAGIVSLDLRTHKERVFPLGDLDALRGEGVSPRPETRPTRSACSASTVSTARARAFSFGRRFPCARETRGGRRTAG